MEKYNLKKIILYNIVNKKDINRKCLYLLNSPIYLSFHMTNYLQQLLVDYLSQFQSRSPSSGSPCFS